MNKLIEVVQEAGRNCVAVGHFNIADLVLLKGVFHRTASVQGLNIAYREAGDPQTPKIVLLHGFPSSSHQYRDLVPRCHGLSRDRT